MHFGHTSHFWFLFLLPLLSAFFLWAIVRKRRAMALFASAGLLEKLTQNVSRQRQQLKYILFLCGTLFLVLALTGPQFGTKLAMAQRKGVDVMVLLDVSRSMQAEDVKPNRLAHAKYQIGQLLDRMDGDRMGLVIFAGQAFVQCPLTLDYGALSMFLDIADTESIAVQGTALAAAIDLAQRSFKEESDAHKVLIIFTDGEEHEGDPLAAAEKAGDEGVRIITVGLGTVEGELIPQRDAQGGVNYHKDRQDQYVKTRLDERTLKSIALATEGDYYRSSRGGAELDAIYEQIAGMDQKELGTTRFTRYEERFQIPLFLALLCFIAEAWLSDRRKAGEEWRGRFA